MFAIELLASVDERLRDLKLSERSCSQGCPIWASACCWFVCSAAIQQQPIEYALGDVAIAHLSREDLGDALRGGRSLDAQLIPHFRKAIEHLGVTPSPGHRIAPSCSHPLRIKREILLLPTKPEVQAGGGFTATHEGRSQAFCQKWIAKRRRVSHCNHASGV